MRDPARIARMCEKLRKIWQRKPDQRLGQLIANFSRTCSPDWGVHASVIFNMEDDLCEVIIDKELNNES